MQTTVHPRGPGDLVAHLSAVTNRHDLDALVGQDGQFTSAPFYVDRVEQAGMTMVEAVRRTMEIGAGPRACDPATSATSATGATATAVATGTRL